jgi:hypothetical protein
MKVNKWTMSLAALGLISIPATGSAEEKMNQVWTALSSTTLSGYVNTSVHWNTGTGNDSLPVHSYNTPTKADGFNLDVVKLTLEKPLDEAQWAAGYKVDLLVGGDASAYGTTVDSNGDGSAAAIKQAYVALRAPVGNGLDFKVGVFDTIIGYESFDSGSNPNYTRSYGFGIEPTTHTGVLMSYQVSKIVSFSAGIGNTIGPVINQKAHRPDNLNDPSRAESYKTYMGSVAITAPEEWGFIAGSTLYAGIVNGYNNTDSAGNAVDWDQTSYYLGVTLNTPVKNLKVGASLDYLQTTDFSNGDSEEVDATAVALYTSFQATEKLSLHLRGEYAETDTALLSAGGAAALVGGNNKFVALTGTVQYDLWKNVLSRLEIRWDHQAGDGDMDGWGSTANGATPDKRNNVLIAGNIIYKF